MQKMIDLHTHSAMSDGSFSPSGLIIEAVKRGLGAIALTDHDTINGLSEAAAAAKEHNIKFIPGIELEISHPIVNNGEFHLLGLGISRPTASFIKAIDELKRRREVRNLQIIEKMNSEGIPVTFGDLQGINLGRPHFAAYLVKQKIVKTHEQAFHRYLRKGKPFYFSKAGMDFDEAVALIHESGGLAVLAHPKSLFIAWGQLPDFIKNLKDKGLDGLEAWHPVATLASCRRLESLAKKLELLITAGSDFHGEYRPERRLGFTSGGKRIDENLLEMFNLNGISGFNEA